MGFTTHSFLYRFNFYVTNPHWMLESSSPDLESPLLFGFKREWFHMLDTVDQSSPFQVNF